MSRLLRAALVAIALLPAAAHADCRTEDLLSEIRRVEPAVLRAADRVAARMPNAEGVFWRIDRAGRPPSWLFGTIHMSDPRVTTLAPEVSRAIAQARLVALELPPDSAADVAEAVRRSARAVQQGGRDLRALVGPEDWVAVDGAMLEAGLDPYRFRFTPPALVAVSLSTAPCERRLRAAGAKILDHVVRDAARAAGKPVIGLETAEEQIAALTANTIPDQVRMLMAAARGWPVADRRADLAIRLWMARRPSYLKALAEAAPSADRAGERTFNMAVFDRRNRVMLARALPLLRQGQVFIAVGAGHLSGSAGLVQLLRNAGFTVTRLDGP